MHLTIGQAIITGLASGVLSLGILIFILRRVFILGDIKADKIDVAEKLEKKADWKLVKTNRERIEEELQHKADKDLVMAELAHNAVYFQKIEDYMKSNDVTTKSICVSLARMESSIKDFGDIRGSIVELAKMRETLDKLADGNGDGMRI